MQMGGAIQTNPFNLSSARYGCTSIQVYGAIAEAYCAGRLKILTSVRRNTANAYCALLIPAYRRNSFTVLYNAGIDLFGLS